MSKNTEKQTIAQQMEAAEKVTSVDETNAELAIAQGVLNKPQHAVVRKATKKTFVYELLGFTEAAFYLNSRVPEPTVEQIAILAQTGNYHSRYMQAKEALKLHMLFTDKEKYVVKFFETQNKNAAGSKLWWVPVHVDVMAKCPEKMWNLVDQAMKNASVVNDVDIKEVENTDGFVAQELIIPCLAVPTKAV